MVFKHHGDKRLGLLKVLSDNEFAVMLANLSDDDCDGMNLYLEDIGLPVAAGKGLALTDAFTGEDRGVVKERISLPVKAHDCELFLAKIADV